MGKASEAIRTLIKTMDDRDDGNNFSGAGMPLRKKVLDEANALDWQSDVMQRLKKKLPSPEQTARMDRWALKEVIGELRDIING